MKNILMLLLSGFLIAGCATDRLYFVEKNHVGLKVEMEPQSETPGMINFGYKRKMATLIPCRTLSTDGKSCAKYKNDVDNEILSVISIFNTRVTWFEGTHVHTYFATGKAAVNTAKSLRAIKALVTIPDDGKTIKVKEGQTVELKDGQKVKLEDGQIVKIQ